MDALLTRSNDPEFPQPGVALSITGVCGVIGLVLPAIVLIYVIALHGAVPPIAWRAAPLGLVIALWPNVRALLRRDLRSINLAVFLTRWCATLSGALALLLFGIDAFAPIKTHFGWIHLAVAGDLLAHGYFVQRWKRRIVKYQSQVRLCPQCQYDLSASIADRMPRCPECGRAIPLHKWDMAAQVELALGRKQWQAKGRPVPPG